jgi:hypothetical protein
LLTRVAPATLRRRFRLSLGPSATRRKFMA